MHFHFIFFLCLSLVFSFSFSAQKSAKKSSLKKVRKDEILDVRDGQKYRTITVGNLIWTADNLNYKTDSSFCYQDDEDNCMAYGRLYTKAAAEKACPAEFHLPTDQNFESLWTKAGADFNAAYLLKSAYGWSGETNGNDTLKFSAMPAGNRFDDGTYGNLSKATFFWSQESHVWYTSSKSMGFNYTEKPESFGFSVRCVRENTSKK